MFFEKFTLSHKKDDFVDIIKENVLQSMQIHQDLSINQYDFLKTFFFFFFFLHINVKKKKFFFVVF